MYRVAVELSDWSTGATIEFFSTAGGSPHWVCASILDCEHHGNFRAAGVLRGVFVARVVPAGKAELLDAGDGNADGNFRRDGVVPGNFRGHRCRSHGVPARFVTGLRDSRDRVLSDWFNCGSVAKPDTKRGATRIVCRRHSDAAGARCGAGEAVRSWHDSARVERKNVRSIGYSIYYTMVNIGGVVGALYADWAHHNLGLENVYRIAAIGVFAMFFVVILFFREPRKLDDAPPPSVAQVVRNFCVVVGNAKLVLPVAGVGVLLVAIQALYPVTFPWWVWVPLIGLGLAGMSKFMWFLVIFTGYWIVFWQQYISLPGYLTKYVSADARVERILATDGLAVIALTVAINALTKKIPAFQAIIIGTLITSVSWLVFAFRPTVWGAVLAIFVLALGEIIQAPRYYEYISRLAPKEQQGTYMGFAFLPIGLGSLIGGWFGGTLLHHFGEVAHQPGRMWWVVTGVGVATAIALWVYDKTVGNERSSAQTPVL